MTLYGHLSRYASGESQGRVKHQILVMSVPADSATGPHLHDEFHVNGVQVQNPLSVRLPMQTPWTRAA